MQKINVEIQKGIFLTFVLCLITVTLKAQCKCETINRSDGTQIVQCQPLPVAYDNTTQIGISAASNGSNDFITVTVRFKNAAQKITGELSLRLDNQSLISLDLVNSQLAYIGNSEVAQGIFQTTSKYLGEMKNSVLKTISFKLSDGMMRTYKVKKNAAILMNQLQCL